MTQMRRKAVDSLFDSAKDSHIGLYLSRGLKEWDEGSTERGQAFQAHIKKVTAFPAPEIYRQAYERWKKMTESNTIATWCGQLDGRLFIGLGGASVLETSITLSKTYGVPLIPGSAVKGLVRAYAEAHGLNEKSKEHNFLFGKVAEKPEDCESGAVIFYDAWWRLESDKTPPLPPLPLLPLVQEIVTVHHQEYYSGSEKQVTDQATDFDSPIPNTQVAAKGSFLFAVECGDSKWAEDVRDLMAKALTNWGIGGKIAAGYGRFVEYVEEISKFRQKIRDELEKLGSGSASKAGDWLAKAEKETDIEKAKEIALEVKYCYEKILDQWNSENPKHIKKREKIEDILSK